MVFVPEITPPSSLLGKGKGEDHPPLTTDHRSDVLLARRIAYERGVVTGGSICSPARARQVLTQYDPRFGGDGSLMYADPTTMRNLAHADEVTQRLVCPGMLIKKDGEMVAEAAASELVQARL